jgi:diketogulonate reductase-like aldo/keto reductase
MRSFFQATSSHEATSLSSCITLPKPLPTNNNASNQSRSLVDKEILMPWVGYGTYRLGQKRAHSAVLSALQTGYRQIDTAFIYGGQTTELQVGKALRDAFDRNILHSREDVFVTTKQWREFHGYDASLKCLEMSLGRLGLDYVDCWMMHWPGPCWECKSRQNRGGSNDNHKCTLEEDGDTDVVWSRAKDGVQKDEMASLRAETWRAMEDAYLSGKARSIAVSNFTIQHLQTLKQTATLWPPAMNQIELHPYYPQNELVEYCQKEGIVIQAYASLGGQDSTKAKWKKLGGKLLDCPPVIAAANKLSTEKRKVTAGQILLRWALQRNCAVIPKTVCPVRMRENANLFDFRLSDDDMKAISNLGEDVDEDEGRLCWRTEPLRMLNFD